MEDQLNKEKRFNTLITIVSIAIPVVVAILFGIKIPGVAPLSILPPVYATINGLTAVVLVLAVLAIKNGQNLNANEMDFIVNGLFACKEPNISPFNKRTYITLTKEDLDNKFN